MPVAPAPSSAGTRVDERPELAEKFMASFGRHAGIVARGGLEGVDDGEDQMVSAQAYDAALR